MKILKRIFAVIILLAVIAAGCVFYAFKIEPFRIKVNEFHMNRETEGAAGIKIVQISDLHIKNDFTADDLGKVVNRINEQEADIVVFTGDLYDNYAKYHDDENIINQLNRIEARYEKIAIWGNRDYGGGASRQYASIMEQSGFRLLENQNWYVTLDNDKKILFTGLDDVMLGKPYMPDDTRIYDSAYEVLLLHEPDPVNDYADYNYNLALSGHSHGGQVDIPLLPMINKKAVSVTGYADNYSGGMYSLSQGDAGQKDGSKLYVNTGIGTTHVSARFGVVPEIAVFHIYV